MLFTVYVFVIIDFPLQPTLTAVYNRSYFIEIYFTHSSVCFDKFSFAFQVILNHKMIQTTKDGFILIETLKPGTVYIVEIIAVGKKDSNIIRSNEHVEEILTLSEICYI